MSNTLVNLRDLRFVLYEQLNAESLAELPYFSDHSRETFDMALDTAYQLSREVFWPSYKEFDEVGAQFDGKTVTAPPSLKGIWQAFKDGGWFAPSQSYEVGGQQFPYVVFVTACVMFNAGNTAAGMYVGQVTGAAHLIESFGSDFLKERFMYKLYAGEWGGTMALTEPDAGSSLGDIKTTAVKAPDGDHYLIRGVKRFISSGDQDVTDNIIHPTLAKIEGAPDGVKGISLFIVPKYRVNDDGSVGEFNDVITAGIEHKMGLKGQATATLNFGEKGECHGWLLGAENKGLSYMFQLMNSARIHTGIQAVGVASCAYYNALEYTKERVQGRPVMSKDPTTPQIPIIQHADVRRMLLTQKAYIEGCTALLMYCAKLGDLHRNLPEAEGKKYYELLEILTPVCKAYVSDVSYESVDLALQCFGGAGYIEEFPVAQMLRDSRVFQIYEGTNNIQAMDLLGRKVAMEHGQYFRALLETVGETIQEAAQREALAEMTAKVSKAMEDLVMVTTHLGTMGLGGDVEGYINHATPYLKIFSQFVVSWQFLWQSTLADKALEAGVSGDEEAFYLSKLATAKFYINTILPTGKPLIEQILESDRGALDFEEAWFG